MARRLISQPMRMRGGSTLGFGARMRVYNDEALTVLSTIYRRSTGAGAQPNPLLPNAGRVTALTVAGAAADTTITVANTAGFQVGDLIPIRSGATFVYKVITAINVGTGVITLDSALGAIYAIATTVVGAPEMRGHVWGWFDTVVDPFAEIEDIASGRRSPPIQVPISVPIAVAGFQEEGVSTGPERPTINFIGARVTATDDVVNSRVNVTIPAVLTTKGDLLGFSAAEARLPVGTNGQRLVADSAEALGVKWTGAGITKIAESVLTVDTASIDFTSIPATYSHLLLVFSGRGSTALGNVSFLMRLNNDSGANYDWLQARITTAGLTNASGSADTSMTLGKIADTSASASAADGRSILIPNYSRTTFHKSVQTQGTAKELPPGELYLASSYWRSAVAVNRVTIFPASGNFLAGSMATLYGWES